MLNTTTLVQLYSQYCNQSSVTLEIAPQNFVGVVCSGFMMKLFVDFVVDQGYTVEQIEEWERNTFEDEGADRFFEDVERSFQQLEV